MLIDTHVHLYDPAFGDYAWPPADSEFHRLLTTGMLQTDADGAVDSCVVVGCSNEYTLNAKLLETTAKDPLVGAYIAQLDPGDPECVSYTHRYSMDAKYRGFRVASQTALAHAYRVLAAHQPDTVIELLGSWRYTARWKDIVSENPGVSFVIEHFGGYPFDGAPVPEDYRAFCHDFASLPNVSIKLSGLYTLCRIFPKPTEPGPFREPFIRSILPSARSAACSARTGP